jgi:hypothetical protein
MYIEEAPDCPANLGDMVAVRRYFTTNERGGTSGPYGRTSARVIRAWWDYETGWRFWGLVGDSRRIYFSEFDIEGRPTKPTTAQVRVLEVARAAGGAESDSELDALELATSALFATAPEAIRAAVHVLVGSPCKYLDPLGQRAGTVAATISVMFALADSDLQQRIAQAFDGLD